MNLRDYQSLAVDNCRAEFAKGRRSVLLVAPTGSGKTVMFSHIVEGAVKKGNKSLVLAHRKELIDQASGKLDAYGVDHGVIMGDHPRWRPWCPVQVASVQTLGKRRIPDAQLLIIDEAHHARASTYAKIMSALPNAVVLGCTASPWRSDNKPLGDLFESVVIASTPSELTAAGYLVPVTGFAFDSPDLHDVKITAGDFNEKQLSEIMSGSKIVGNVVEQWAARANGVRTVLFAVTVEHSKKLVSEFQARGVKAEHLDGTTPKAQREAILARLSAGTTTLVSNVGVLTEGWDCPQIECCVLARPTMSLGLYLQMVGRIRRPYVGKEKARIHDHAGCVLRHGLPDQDRDYSLAPATPKGRKANSLECAAPVRQCASCFALYPPEIPACPLCGLVNPRRERKIENVEGQAIAFEDIEKIFAREEPSKIKQDLIEWKAVAEIRGYKPGWVSYMFKSKYGRWPRRGEV